MKTNTLMPELLDTMDAYWRAPSHSIGDVFDNAKLVVTCVVGDGEAKTGPLATAWHSNRSLNPTSDGAVLPILQLNGTRSPTRRSSPASRVAPKGETKNDP